MDINLSSQIVVQTAAQWAADATVYSNKRILVTSDAFYGSTDQRKFKIADGVQTWAQLDYFPLDVALALTLSQALTNGNSVDEQSILSQNGKSVLQVFNDYIYQLYDNTFPAYGDHTINDTQQSFSHGVKLRFDSPIFNIAQATASRIVETDASKNLTYAAKGTAYNKNFGVSSGDILLLGSTSVASQILATDSNNQVQTLATATYPSLTELSYVKGVTSAIQTQLDAKVDTFTISLLPGQLSPADSTTYYWGSGLVAPSITATDQDFNFGYSFTIIGVNLWITNTSSGSAELATIQIRNTTQSTSSSVGTTATNGTSTVPLTVAFTGLNISVGASDFIAMQIDTPAWVTNPTGVRLVTQLICRI